MKCILRLFFQVRLNKLVPTVCLTKLPGDGFLVILLIFPIHFFSSLFSRHLRYKLSSFLVVMALLLNHDGFGRNWTIVLRDFAKSLRKLKNIFFQKKRFFTSTFIVDSIISFISFSKGRWKLNKTIFYDLQPKNLIYFDQIETKLTSEMEEEKPFIFAGFFLPTRSCLVCFHMMTFSWQKGVGKNTSRWS